MFTKYQRPCDTRQVRDDYAAHVARGSVLPGLDYACNTGDKCYAAATGKVIAVTTNPNQPRGLSITLRHRDGNETHYLHLSKMYVQVGDKVARGDQIANTGNTGTTSTGAHLHFAIKDKTGRCIDPAAFLAKKATEEKAIAKAKRQLENAVNFESNLPKG